MLFSSGLVTLMEQSHLDSTELEMLLDEAVHLQNFVRSFCERTYNEHDCSNVHTEIGLDYEDTINPLTPACSYANGPADRVDHAARPGVRLVFM